MLSRLVQRVLPRVYASNVVSMAGLRPAMLVRQQLVARTFLTTAYLSEPATKSTKTAGRTVKKPAAKSATKKKPAAKKAAPKKRKAAKKKAAPKKAKSQKKGGRPKVIDPNDPEGRFKKGLKAVKVHSSERPPMRPVGAYALFLKERYIQGGPVGSREAFTSKAKEISAEWKQMSEADKQTYKDQATALRGAFEKAREEWHKNTDPRILRAYNLQRKAKNQAGVRVPRGITHRTLSPYFQFIQEKRDSAKPADYVPSLEHNRELSKKLGEMWRALPDEEKAKYGAKAGQQRSSSS